MLALSENQRVIDALYSRLDDIAEQCGESFPLYRRAGDALWTVSRRGSWLGGLWTALWWQRAAYSGSDAHLRYARRACHQLEGQLAEPSLNRSFVFAYGAGLGSQLAQCPDAQALGCRAAWAVAADYRSDLGGWLLGAGMGGGAHGARTLDVDALAPTLSLLHVPADAQLALMARSHLDLCLRTLATPSGAWAAQASMEADGQLHPVAPGAWARGQAWALLGLAEAVERYGAEYAEAARQAGEYWLQYWGEAACQPQVDYGVLDPCAAAIASVALLRLSTALPTRAEWREQARRQNARLREQVGPGGRFVGHHYRTGARAEPVESACASFYLIQALALEEA